MGEFSKFCNPTIDNGFCRIYAQPRNLVGDRAASGCRGHTPSVSTPYKLASRAGFCGRAFVHSVFHQHWETNMFRSVMMVAAVAAIFAMATNVQAGEIPDNVLAQMGLGGMKRMSDQQGMRVRGQGTAAVLGAGLSTVIAATDFNSFGASSNTVNALATGSSQTTAQISATLTIAGVSASISLTAATAGSAHAFGR